MPDETHGHGTRHCVSNVVVLRVSLGATQSTVMFHAGVKSGRLPQLVGSMMTACEENVKPDGSGGMGA